MNTDVLQQCFDEKNRELKILENLNQQLIDNLRRFEDSQQELIQRIRELCVAYDKSQASKSIEDYLRVIKILEQLHKYFDETYGIYDTSLDWLK